MIIRTLETFDKIPPGVSYDNHGRRWRACIAVKNQRLRLGSYVTREEAIKVRLDAEMIYGKPTIGFQSGPPSRIWIIKDEMALLEVFPDQLALIDADNVEIVRDGKRWHMFGNYVYSNFLHCKLHQHILGSGGNGHSIHTDHIDRNPLNNLESNLRIVSPSENQFNSGLREDNTSGVKGVHRFKRTGRWTAYIHMNGKKRHLGYFDSIEEAAKARREAEEGRGAHA